ncbi:MAG: peptide ABC transporter ATP-binding protein [Tenericutes bacterium GWC2_34_14]|nr:MAG: peptide ABC transporter ATP-binding protein [Tenericutes bacterium GWA2_35_7]OHE28457.1 MAG: peptide ABC transporter ATP-binding protein [Tenericutes bacterium GWC2_34_14]OHE33635.1 MAG: peptide ABC transporter ATP-binding protein [Tenericutes bacterium GWE2_34_108]OHE36920.1 MAG: peptide ABC transporter ATP-binding protein [Tenericutes bacterium GWF1_35_14]OHE38000.1 MAG: peptide ABC transporter ATP-binding protein [Tenericutes bacterium GWF2_35_184]OHE43483.1 MAG: peptide ABC transpo
MNDQIKEPLLKVVNLKKYFDLTTMGHKKVLAAVDDISFEIYKGETFGLVGESGCGKTTTGRVIVNLYRPTGGNIIFDGVDYSDKSERELKPFRKRVQMIFQDPYASLNSRMTVFEIISEGIKTHRILGTKEEIETRVHELLEKVGLKREHAGRYPHEFSGGQRQRIGIARALALNPEMIVADEPISALDVSIQAQVINMLEDLQKEFNLTYLFIAHDLSMVRHISDRIGVMYLGKIMEIGESDAVYERPLHPYTESLLSSIPIADPKIRMSEKRIILEGDVMSPINPKPGCRFASRCRYAKERCFSETPEVREVEPKRFVACHLVEEIRGLFTEKVLK